MHIKTLEKLERLGWNSETLHYIHDNFAPKKSGKYKIQIYTMNYPEQRPEDGMLIETAYFDGEQELSLIHHFYQGNGYVLSFSKSEKKISSGILNGAPFGEVEEDGWRWLSREEMKMRKPRRSKPKNGENKEEIEEIEEVVEDSGNDIPLL